MSIIVGRKHGNGYHDNVYRKIEVGFSENIKELLDYELSQLEEHSGVIYEREFIPLWVERVCIRCPTTYLPEYMENRSNIFICPECELKKIPKGIEYKGGKNEDG